jgi:hypothetical protein
MRLLAFIAAGDEDDVRVCVRFADEGCCQG